MRLHFPYRIDGRGRTAATNEDDHVRQLVEQVLLTSPGERVNRPELGSGLMELVFAGNSPELAAATQFRVQGALQQHLDELVQVAEVEARSDGPLLVVVVRYVLRRTGEPRTARFERGLPE